MIDNVNNEQYQDANDKFKSFKLENILCFDILIRL